MADVFGLLSPTDLQGFSQRVEASDPFGLISRSLQSWQPDLSRMNAQESGMTSFGRAFLSGLAQNYAQNRAAEQLSKVVEILPQLTSDPYSVATPEGVDSSPFNLLRGSAILNKSLRGEEESVRDKNRIGTLLQSVLPELVRGRQISVDDALEISTSDDPAKELKLRTKAPPAMGLSTEIEGTGNPLASGRQATSEKIKGYFQEFLQAGSPPGEAMRAAKDQVKGEMAANNKSFDDAKAARSYGENLLQMANTARAGLSEAGQTGSGLASLYEKVISTAAPILPGDQAEAKRQAAGDTLLNSIAPDIIKMARPIGGGATSDFEAKAYLGSGPSSSLTPESNAVLIRKLEQLGQLNLDYADFLEAYREANSGSVVGAAKKWSEYKQQFPIFVGQGDAMQINEQRPTWQEYFEAVGSGDVPAAAPDPTMIRAEAQALAAQGKSSAEISAILRGKYGG